MPKVTHRMSRTPTHISWLAMKQRCRNVKNKKYESYGGAGIDYCKEWEDFSTFLSDMGVRPEGKTLDRIDGTKGYFPGNCRWATIVEQANNVKTVHRLDYMGQVYSAKSLAELLGLKYTTLLRRLWNHRQVDAPLSKGKRLPSAVTTVIAEK